MTKTDFAELKERLSERIYECQDFAESTAIISELIEIIKLQSECTNGYSHDYITLKMNACVAETTTRLQKLRDGK